MPCENTARGLQNALRIFIRCETRQTSGVPTGERAPTLPTMAMVHPCASSSLSPVTQPDNAFKACFTSSSRSQFCKEAHRARGTKQRREQIGRFLIFEEVLDEVST